MATPLPYPAPTVTIPHAQRDPINRGILNLIRSGAKPDAAKVFAGYTGKGGLHGLRYEDFESRYAFSEAKRVFEQGQFFTPDHIVGLISRFLNVASNDNVADLTSGAGAFANHFRGQSFFGLEIDADAVTVARYLYPEAEICEGDIRAWAPSFKARFLVGNPPFALRWMVPNCPLANASGEAASEDVFLWKSREALAAGGTLCFVAPAAWLTDDLVCAKALAFIQENFERVAEVLLPAKAFASVGVDNFATKIVLLRRWLPGETARSTIPAAVDGRALDTESLLRAWIDACPGYFGFRASLGGKRAVLELADQQSARRGTNERTTVCYRFLRRLAELGRKNASAAAELARKWQAANAPATYDRIGNRLPQISIEAVMNELRRELRALDEKPLPLVRIVRTKTGIKAKAYNRAAVLALNETKFDASNGDIACGGVTAEGIEQAAELVRAALAARNGRRKSKDALAERIKFEGLNVRRTVARLQRSFNLWGRPLSASAPELPGLKLRIAAYYGALAGHGIVVKEKQVDALARVTAKAGGFVAWEMGAGKSLASLAWDSIKRGDDAARRAGRVGSWTLLVSSALAIELHWTEQLAAYGLEFLRPDSRAAWASVQTGGDGAQRFLLATHYQVSRYAKVMRGLVRQGIVRAVIVDESDEFGNRGSRRSQRLLVAGREAPHKLLLTGTPVRNNAGELFNQCSLLLHGEPFFRSTAKTQVVYNTDIRDFIEIGNPDFLRPYVGRGAFAMFKRCHAPARPTVMGAERSIPALPNRETLEEFLGCFRSRLRLRDLLDREPFERETVSVELPVAERRLYDQFAKAAVEIARAHLAAGTSDRRATMLSLAQAIRLLQQVASMPGKFGLRGAGAKENAVVELIRRSAATHVAVGVIWRESVERLLPVLQREFPDRVIVAFDGDDTFAQRRRKLDQLEAAPRGLLVSTQQSIRSSLNLPIISEVIAEAMPWNFTGLNQYTMRFCRLTSRALVKVRLLIAVGTIEERILGLLLRKQSVALPVAGDAFEGEDELFTDYGIVAEDLDELARYLAQHEPPLRASPETVAA